MNSRPDISKQLASFSGRAPLFPLAEAVLLPHVLVPLHIFEPRYREMTADALSGDGLISTARLQDLAADDAESPPINQTVCLGRIAGWKRLVDGRYYILLQGICRAEIIREVSDSHALYRVAELRLLVDDESNLTEEIQENLRHDLMSVYREVCPQIEVNQLFQTGYTSRIALGAMCDVLAHSLPPQPGWTQAVLEQRDVKQRAEMLLEFLRHGQILHAADGSVRFPPSFSAN